MTTSTETGKSQPGLDPGSPGKKVRIKEMALAPSNSSFFLERHTLESRMGGGVRANCLSKLKVLGRDYISLI